VAAAHQQRLERLRGDLAHDAGDPVGARNSCTRRDVLIVGAGNRSAIGTLVERTSHYTILLHLADDRSADAVETAVIAAFAALPEHLRRSLTWDQGNEMACHADITRTMTAFWNPTGLPRRRAKVWAGSSESPTPSTRERVTPLEQSTLLPRPERPSLCWRRFRGNT
jgi:hypothetical protein